MASSPDFNWNTEQRQAIDRIRGWADKTESGLQLSLTGAAGSGKQQPVDCMVQTPTGPIEIGNVRRGDYVFGSNGTPTRVIGVFPQGMQQAYRVTFRDGSSTECGAEHNWTVIVPPRPERGKLESTKVLTTSEMISAGVERGPWKGKTYFRHRIPLCSPVQYTDAHLPIHPYLLGVMIGDGTSLGKTPTLVCPDHEIVNRCREVIPQGVRVNEIRGGTCLRHTFSWPQEDKQNRFAEKFRDLGLNVKSLERFIPREYLQGSVQQRLDLLRGLMDTDGSCCENRTSFSTMSRRLASDIVLLVQSLGGTAMGSDGYDRGDKGVEFHINVKLQVCPFYLRRKADRWSPSRKNPPSRYVVDISKSRIVEQVCIEVDAMDNLYLTDEFIVTHNTTVLKAIQPFLQSNDVCWAAMTGKAALRMHEVVGVPAKTLHSVLYQRPNKGKGNRLYFNTVKAPDCKYLVIDEASMMPPKIYQDLQSWQMNGVRILYVGDGYQLPPILDHKEIKEYGEDFSIFKEVEGPALVQVMRSGDDIIKVATQLREENHVPKKNIGDAYRIRRSKTPGRDACSDFLKDNDNHVLITWRNKMRMQANRLIRKRLGFDGVLPHKGEPVMICKNGNDMFNDDESVLNGEIHWADYFTEGPKLGPEVNTMKFVTDLGINLIASTQGKSEPMDGAFPNVKDWKEYMKHFKVARVPDPIPITYGYVSTAHKAQGSEYNKVTIFLSAEDMSNPHFKKDTILPNGEKMSFATRWLYTSLTRARHQVSLILGS